MNTLLANWTEELAAFGLRVVQPRRRPKPFTIPDNVSEATPNVPGLVVPSRRSVEGGQ
jgi:hypothetical protein